MNDDRLDKIKTMNAAWAIWRAHSETCRLSLLGRFCRACEWARLDFLAAERAAFPTI